MFNPFGMFFPKRMLGIDVGTSSIKVVEISGRGGGKTLENYAEVKSDFLYKEAPLKAEKGDHSSSNNFTAKIIRGILNEARIKTKAAIFSIPDFSTFCTSFDLPPMTEKEVPNAIRYNASQYITLPMAEVTLDWRVMLNGLGKNSSWKVLLVAVPNQVIQDYKVMAKMAGLELYAMEAEALGITRVFLKNSKKTVCLVDVGLQSSTINIVDKGFLKKSYSFNFDSGQMARVIASLIGVDIPQAEEIKNRQGLIHPRQDVVKALYASINPLLVEMKTMFAEFLQSEQKQIEEIYLTGGTANLPGLKEYFAESLKKNVYVPNCFSDFLYPPILEESLREMSPSFSAAAGVALWGLET